MTDTFFNRNNLFACGLLLLLLLCFVCFCVAFVVVVVAAVVVLFEKQHDLEKFGVCFCCCFSLRNGEREKGEFEKFHTIFQPKSISPSSFVAIKPLQNSRTSPEFQSSA